jgi:hypothetical protein
MHDRTVAITPGKSKLYSWDEVKRVCQESTLSGMTAMSEAGLNKPFRFVYMSGAGTERDPAKQPTFMPGYSKLRVSLLLL